MGRSKYREQRTLVRSILKPRDQDKNQFRDNVNRLRNHFQRFNTEVSELCQWLMWFRPDGKNPNQNQGFLWDLFLNPEQLIGNVEEARIDRIKVDAFDIVAGFISGEGCFGIGDSLRVNLKSVQNSARNPTSRRLFERLERLSGSHRMVLLKAATEWIQARYLRAMDNWRKHHPKWEEEKGEWETSHPDLTLELRSKFNSVYDSLKAYEEIKVRRKNPRICTWERLAQKKDNCEYAGERIGIHGHSPLCRKFRDFKRDSIPGKDKKFVANVEKYLEIRKSQRSQEAALCKYESEFEKQYRKPEFRPNWLKYLIALGINEQTIVSDYNAQLPHCTELGNECAFNRHTELCREYYTHFDSFLPDERKLEELYREWRKKYFSGPRKPTFRYPSSRDLPVPKIFGRDYYDVDFQNSILRLRLDDMRENEFLTFGIRPWPVTYNVQPENLEITSVSVSFVGTRPRAGFRFSVPHRRSRFAVSQDELDKLRSQEFPRQAEDQKFLDAAREMLIKSFDGEPSKEIKLLAVDLGESSAAAALFEGKRYREEIPLKIIKIDRLMEERPKPNGKKGGKTGAKDGTLKGSGVSKEHIERHLKGYSEGVKKMTKFLSGKGSAQVSSGTHDFRRLTTHTRWMIRDWVRLNAKQVIDIAEKCGADLIVFESMRGFGAPGYEQARELDKKRRLGFFAFGSVRRKVVEKAVERGMRVVTVPYLCSSQHCSTCGGRVADLKVWRNDKLGKNQKKKKIFKCQSDKCGVELDSDANAARVIARVFWDEIRLPTTAE